MGCADPGFSVFAGGGASGSGADAGRGGVRRLFASPAGRNSRLHAGGGGVVGWRRVRAYRRIVGGNSRQADVRSASFVWRGGAHSVDGSGGDGGCRGVFTDAGRGGRGGGVNGYPS